jgi:hypothetical protein
MALQYSTAVRNAKLDAVEVTIGANAVLEIRSGAPPANPAAADTGTLLASLSLPADYMNAAAGGVKTKNGTWEDLIADNTGIAGHWRLKDSTATVCGAQGTCSLAGGGGDMILDNTNITAGQSFTVTAFTLTAGNA